MNKKQKPGKVLYDLNHPADFHFFKHLIIWMKSEGYPVKIIARDKECLHMLLDDAGFSYSSRGKGKHTLLGKYVYAFYILLLLLLSLLRFRPALTMSLSSPYLALLSRILGIPCVTYDDTDNNPRLLPLIRKSTYILSPATYPHSFHQNHFHLPALKELAYLHPGQFQQNPKRTGLFFRLTRTDSVHHSDASQLEMEPIHKKIEQLSRDYPILFSSETNLDSIDNINIQAANPLRIHKDLAGCRLFWGNSATMAAEAAVLGIPAIFVSAEKFAYISELEDAGLLFHYHPGELQHSLEKIDEILDGQAAVSQYHTARMKLLGEKIDMTAFLIWFVSTLPESALTLQKDPGSAREFITGS